MKQVRCLYCGFFGSRHGKTYTGRQRWYCKECHSVFVNPINKTVHDFKHFIQWLFGKDVQKSMPGGGRNFRRKITKFWGIWPMPPKIESVVYVDSYLFRKKSMYPYLL